MTKLWNLEPLLVTLVGSAAFWPALFALLRAFGHPLTHDQQDALAGLKQWAPDSIVEGITVV